MELFLWPYIREMFLVAIGGFFGAVFGSVATGNINLNLAVMLVIIYAFITGALIILLDFLFEFKRK